MGRMKDLAEQYHSIVVDRMHEIASDGWWEMEDQIEYAKSELAEQIKCEMQDIEFVEEGLTGEDIIEIMQEDLDDLIEEAIDSEWQL